MRTRRAWLAGAGAAVLVAVGMTGSVAEEVPSATAAPATGLSSGDSVAVQLTGFAPDSPVYGVQCDERVLATGDSAFCDSEHVAVLVPDATGAATGDVVVRAVDDFTSANGQGICDATAACVLAFQQPTEAGALATVAPISFGARTWSLVEAPSTSRTKKVELDVTVLARSRTVPTGTVQVLERGELVEEAVLDAAGQSQVVLPLRRGIHRLEVRYGGDRVFLPSAGDLRIRVAR